jgi:hypothetical protein
MAKCKTKSRTIKQLNFIALRIYEKESKIFLAAATDKQFASGHEQLYYSDR